MRLTVDISAGTDESLPSPWVLDIQRLRAAAVWEGGLRPGFRRGDGTFCDPDPHDWLSYHLLLRTVDTDAVVAGVRAAPVEALPDSRIRSWDAGAADRLLTAYGSDDRDVLEAGRLWVVPEWRRAALGTHLLVATAALGRVLGRRLLWGTLGTRGGQHGLFSKLGWQICQEFGFRDVPALVDTLCVAVMDVDSPADPFRSTMVDFARLVTEALDQPSRANDARRATYPAAQYPGVRS